MPAYTVSGEPIPDERALRLRGYPGGTARAGNQVVGQFQLDGLGEALQLFAAAARLDVLAEENWRAAATAADAIGKRWTGDPRSRATIRAVREELAEDGYAYRFRQDPRPLHKAEGAFLLCGFWLAQVAQACGEHAEAGHWFERNRAACGPAGLYTEEYDVHQRQLRGNLPQAFVHAGLLETAARMSARS